MSEHFVTENGISHLRSIHEVHLKQASLEMTLFWQIIFQRLEQELGCLLNHALGLEDVGHLKAQKMFDQLSLEDVDEIEQRLTRSRSIKGPLSFLISIVANSVA